MSKLAINGGPKVRNTQFPTWPIWDETDCKALVDVCNSGNWFSLSGTKVKEFAEAFAAYQGCKWGVCVPNGTIALVVALQAAGVKCGDEVIVTPYTFIASASSIRQIGAKPVFVDIDLDTYNIDVSRIEAAITDKTKAIMPVHIGGMPMNMDELMAIARKHNLRVIEDCAQAHAAEWNGQRVGSFGDAGTFSFQASKNLTAGEGGIIVSNNEQVAELSWSIHNVGRVRGGKWYEHPVMGCNYRMTEFQGAILLNQMKKLDAETARRSENGLYLADKLSKLDGVKPLARDKRVTNHAYHLFITRYMAGESNGVGKEKFIEALKAEGIPCLPGYLPLYQSGMLAEQYPGLHMPNTERASEHEAIWLTQNILLGERKDMDDIADAIEKVLENASELG